MTNATVSTTVSAPATTPAPEAVLQVVPFPDMSALIAQTISQTLASVTKQIATEQGGLHQVVRVADLNDTVKMMAAGNNQAVESRVKEQTDKFQNAIKLQERIGDSATKALLSASECKTTIEAQKAMQAAGRAAIKELLANKKVEGDEATFYTVRARDAYIGIGVTTVFLAAGGVALYKVGHNAGVKSANHNG